MYTLSRIYVPTALSEREVLHMDNKDKKQKDIDTINKLLVNAPEDKVSELLMLIKQYLLQ